MHQILGMGVDRRVDHEGISGQNRRRAKEVLVAVSAFIIIIDIVIITSIVMKSLTPFFDVGPLPGGSGHMFSFPLSSLIGTN